VYDIPGSMLFCEPSFIRIRRRSAARYSQSCEDLGVVSGGFDFRFLITAVLFGVGGGSTTVVLSSPADAIA
jgi:hypothetical protein